MSPAEQSRFKYVVHIAGHAAAYRLGGELAMQSVVLIVDSPYRMWFSDWLEPYTHYVPVAADLSDLVDRIRWCRAHDAECRAIAAAGRRFFETRLSRGAILDYMGGLVGRVGANTLAGDAWRAGYAPKKLQSRLKSAE
jgi:hypothetical protein